ncbi:DUF2889 domain-containing protein [Pseudomonas sp. 148P]|uniref:DUF2889 domain-containing protein n=1 Tax=Pseudomonas ulcerans TaxID=3115852 RepID=A0ABU7HWP6_9PSED|nr:MULTISPECIES: DUF2889 domain-containing protein [unclassified Pseudomonas]MEE1924580.1 DUF2889 domain-containing protein [Pseudomonas sp. 147P]MEE1935994.1 DUF2889 domain-containing protein [Pseudomonas sp. 148P]
MTAFRRRVDITASADHVRAALEDDFHHFRVWANHCAGQVTAIGGEALRYPYSLCPQACDQLQALVDMPLARIAHTVTRQTDASHQCTHLLDLAGLAIASAARGICRRRYAIQVGARIDGRTRARLTRDDGLVLNWEINGTMIESPSPYAGVNLREGMARWALGTLSEDVAEAALLLRRCTLISMGRAYNLDEQVHATSSGRCYSQQAERAERALRMKGSTLDFSDEPQALCAQDQTWLHARPDGPTA